MYLCLMPCPMLRQLLNISLFSHCISEYASPLPHSLSSCELQQGQILLRYFLKLISWKGLKSCFLTIALVVDLPTVLQDIPYSLYNNESATIVYNHKIIHIICSIHYFSVKKIQRNTENHLKYNLILLIVRRMGPRRPKFLGPTKVIMQPCLIY